MGRISATVRAMRLTMKKLLDGFIRFNMDLIPAGTGPVSQSLRDHRNGCRIPRQAFELATTMLWYYSLGRLRRNDP